MRTAHALKTAPRPAVPGSVVAYVRISDARGSTEGTARQTTDVRRLARDLGLPAPRVVEGDKSASRHKRKLRPQFLELCADMEAGRVTDLLVWHQDRWTREPRELEMLIDVVEATGVRVHAVLGGFIDLTTTDGRLNARIKADLAAYESDHRSDRVRRAAQQRAEKGKAHGGGRRPFGYDVTGMVLVPAEAAVVKDLTVRIIGGESCRGLATYLRVRGIPTATGEAKWTAAAVRQLVWRARNAALREHGGTETIGIAEA